MAVTSLNAFNARIIEFFVGVLERRRQADLGAKNWSVAPVP
jgi:hypothetical protein